MGEDDDWFERVVLDPSGAADDAPVTVAAERAGATSGRADGEDDFMLLVADATDDPDAGDDASSTDGPDRADDSDDSAGTVDSGVGGNAVWTSGAAPARADAAGRTECPDSTDGPDSTDEAASVREHLPSEDPPTEEIPVVRFPDTVSPSPDSRSDSGSAAVAAMAGGELSWSDYGDIVDTSEVSVEEMTGIWLSPDLVRESPLRMDGEPIDPEEVDLPPEVCDRLRDWSDQWQAEWDPDRGWLPRARIGDFEALGHWLARRVKDGVGALDVTLHLPHLGRSGIERIAEPGRRRPMIVTLGHAIRGRLPVRGEFVTEFGVGSFSSEINGRLEAWADDVRAHRDDRGGWRHPDDADEFAEMAEDLADDMETELGPDYLVELELWPE